MWKIHTLLTQTIFIEIILYSPLIEIYTGKNKFSGNEKIRFRTSIDFFLRYFQPDTQAK